MEYIITGKTPCLRTVEAAQDTKITSKENPLIKSYVVLAKVRLIFRYQPMNRQKRNAKKIMTKAKEEIAKSGNSGESANRMIQAMANLSADEIEDDGTYDVLIITNTSHINNYKH